MDARTYSRYPLRESISVMFPPCLNAFGRWEGDQTIWNTVSNEVCSSSLGLVYMRKVGTQERNTCVSQIMRPFGLLPFGAEIASGP